MLRGRRIMKLRDAERLRFSHPPQQDSCAGTNQCLALDITGTPNDQTAQRTNSYVPGSSLLDNRDMRPTVHLYTRPPRPRPMPCRLTRCLGNLLLTRCLVPLLTRGGKESCFDRTTRVTCASDGEHFACRASLDIMCAVSCDGLVHCVPCFPGAIQARGCEAGLVQPSLPLDLAMQLVALLPRGRFSFVDKASAGDLQPYR